MKPDSIDQPYLENYPVLREWIDKHNARCLWQQYIDNEGRSMGIEGWVIAGSVFIIQMFSHGRGWGIFTQLDSNETAKTLQDAEQRLGITGRVRRLHKNESTQCGGEVTNYGECQKCGARSLTVGMTTIEVG